MTKGLKQEEDIIFINIYAPNIGSPKYIKQILTDGQGLMISLKQDVLDSRSEPLAEALVNM